MSKLKQATIHALFELQVEQFPAYSAVIHAEQALSYLELNERANQFAHYLRTCGVQPQTRIAVCMDRSIQLIVAILGILKAGGAYIPLDPDYPKERISFIMTENEHPLFITSAKYRKKFSTYQSKMILLDKLDKTLAKYPIHNPHLSSSAHHLAYIIYTSGSTGQPKGVLIEHRSVVNYGLWFTNTCHCLPRERIDFSSNYIFDMSITSLLIPPMFGMTIVICEEEIKKNFRQYIDYIEENRVNIIKITPSYFRALHNEIQQGSKPSLSYLRKIVLGGEALHTAHCLPWLNEYPRHTLYNEYGPTEATVGSTIFTITSKNIMDLPINIPIGQAGSNIKLYLLDNQLQPLPAGETGELYIGGIGLARGYLKRPKLTKKHFISNPFASNTNSRLYKTGDLCQQLANGDYVYLGRIDQQVKIRGFRVEPEEIEKYLLDYPGLSEVAVIVREDLLNEKQLVAYYKLKNVQKVPTISQFRKHLLNFLPHHMIPNVFVRIDTMPLTPNGKLDQAALPAPRFSINQHYLPPKNTTEIILAQIWSEVLGVTPIGMKDDFFELGGHSLSAARIISQINTQFHKHISLADFYQAATLGKLAAKIKRIKSKKQKNPILERTLHTETPVLPLSDFQLMLWISDTFEPKAKRLNIVARKRFKGHLDKNALTSAFTYVLEKHEVLRNQILTFRPGQIVKKELYFKLEEQDLRDLSIQKRDEVLQHSAEMLAVYHDWHKNRPLLLGYLFYLKNHYVELQICIPHVVADDICPDIIFNDLSDYYQLIVKQAEPIVTVDKNHRHYIVEEQHYFQNHIDRDIQFWERYLTNTELYTFPPEMIIEKMQNTPYSTLQAIPEAACNRLQHFCGQNHLSIQDGLSAALVLALKNCNPIYHDEKQHIFINLVKSTRNETRYDETIGCFLRLEPVKLLISNNSSLLDLAKQAHQSILDTNLYQRCSSLVKLASLPLFLSKQTKIRAYLIRLFVYTYTALFPTPAINRKILTLCGRLRPFEHDNHFLININVRANFIHNIVPDKPTLFGLNEANIKTKESDLLKIDRLFDVCFLRAPQHNKPCVVISTNLHPDFRKRIAQEIVNVLMQIEVTPQFMTMDE